MWTSSGMEDDKYADWIVAPVEPLFSLKAWSQAHNQNAKFFFAFFLYTPIMHTLFRPLFYIPQMNGVDDEASDESIRAWWLNVQGASRMHILGWFFFIWAMLKIIKTLLAQKQGMGKAISTSAAFKKRSRMIMNILTWLLYLILAMLLFHVVLCSPPHPSPASPSECSRCVVVPTPFQRPCMPCSSMRPFLGDPGANSK